MRINEAKRQMMMGKPAMGIVASLGCPLACELCSLAGFDFVLVDNQHGAWDANSSQIALHSICLGNATPMVRVPNDFYAIGSLLDRGALGIVVPMVNSVHDAMSAVQAVHYPPRGSRSVGHFAAAFHGSDYLTRADQEVFLAVQIETVEAVNQAEQILAVEGVDGCWIGPSDLALSLGLDARVERGKDVHEAAISRVLDACRKTGKIPGIHASAESAGQRLAQGFLFVTAETDGRLLTSAAKGILAGLRGPAGT